MIYVTAIGAPSLKQPTTPKWSHERRENGKSRLGCRTEKKQREKGPKLEGVWLVRSVRGLTINLESTIPYTMPLPGKLRQSDTPRVTGSGQQTENLARTRVNNGGNVIFKRIGKTEPRWKAAASNGVSFYCFQSTHAVTMQAHLQQMKFYNFNKLITDQLIIHLLSFVFSTKF